MRHLFGPPDSLNSNTIKTLSKEGSKSLSRSYSNYYNQYNKQERDHERHNFNGGAKTSNKSDFYEMLGVSRKASIDQIKDQFRKLALKYHPDSTAAGLKNVNKSLV